MNDLISRQTALDALINDPIGKMIAEKYNLVGWLEGLPSAQPEQQWIPISERQPKRCDYYIVTDSDSAGEAYYGSDRRWWADGNKLKDVTAWMPLPEPYKEG